MAEKPPFPSVAFEAGLLELLRSLEAAFSSAPEKDEPEDRRARYIIALRGVSGFLRSLRFPPHLYTPFFELAAGLADLEENNHPPPFLKSRKVGGRPRDGHFIWIGRAHVALELDQLMASGCSKTEGIKQIADRRSNALKLLTSPGAKNLAATVAGWHRAFASGEVEDDIAQAIYDEGIQYVGGRRSLQ
jgi:hypothetical protein